MLPKIRQRREQPTDDVLGMLVRARDDQGNALSDEQLIAHTNILLVAGHETSTSLSAWLLYLLSQHPKVEARLHAELAAALGGRAAAIADLPRLGYAEQVVKEAERTGARPNRSPQPG